MLQRLLLVGLVFLAAACDKPCVATSECGTGNYCVPNLNRCRKLCEQPADCGGSTVCSPLPGNIYSCLYPSEIVRSPDMTSNDMSLGNQCFSPMDNGVSAATGGFEMCGSGAPLCNDVFKGDPGLSEIQTCTTECSVDSDCAAESPTNCLGDCRRDFDNLCCFPSLPVKDMRQYTGAKNESPGKPLALYCRPRLFCYLVPKRCKSDGDCGRAGSRAGDKCQTAPDGGGACLNGKLGMYECCQREGECNQGTAMGGAGGLSCQPSIDNLSGYCTKPCTTDADCQSTGAPNASCWTTTYEESDVAGQCHVVQNANPICRNQPKPQLQTPPSKLVKCDYQDRPIELMDNKYNANLRRCDRTF